MAEEKKDERKETMNKRFQERKSSSTTSTTSSTSTDSSTSTSSKTSKRSNTDEETSDQNVREKSARTMYLGEDLIEDLDIKYETLVPEYRREYGEKLQKNRDFYPAAMRAALNETSIREELGLDNP